jgi:thymidylate synthase
MPSRAGNVIVAPAPVTTIYAHPTERVLFWSERDANPFLHFFEALWMLGGRRDVAYLTNFVKRFADYSDDGQTLAGAYGYRWKKHWREGRSGDLPPEPIDQIARVIALLKANPYSRRGVLTMFDPIEDLRMDESARDIPCNLNVMFGISYGKRDEPNHLNIMTVARSHDAIWGAYGTNAVTFSMLQEYVAAHLGLMVGTFEQVSFNYHGYEDVFEKTYRGTLREPPDPLGPYSAEEVAPYPMVTNPATWDRDLALFFEDPAAYGYDNPFFPQVAKPLWFAHKAYKKKDIPGALEIVSQCQASDWRRAATEWLRRRIK